MLHERSIHAFIQKYGIKTESGKPFDLRSHLFWFDVLSDMSPKQVWYKAAQCGGSTVAIIKTLWLARYRGMNVGYTCPTADDAKTFVSGKVNPIIDQNPILQQFVKDKDSVEQKRVGRSTIYYRGTFTERAALSVSLDLRVHDECDRSDQKIIDQYASRLQHSDYGWEWQFSNPSSPGNGVGRFWPLSTQNHWFIKCSHCNEKQYLKWPESVDMERKVYVCRSCRKELSDENRRRGEWVKKFKDREWSGYWFSALMAPWLTAGYVIDQFKTKPKDYFFNFVLGLPYVGEGNTVTSDMIYQNLTDRTATTEDCVIGCDSGIIKHYVVANREGLLSSGKTEDWDDVARLLRRLPRSILIVDGMPDITGPRKLREDFPGRVFLNYYSRDRKTMELIRWGKGTDAGTVLTDRNRMMQLVIDELAEMRIPVHGTRDEWEELVEHFLTLYRVNEPDALGTPFFKWATNSGMDHFCFVVGTMVETEDGPIPIEQVPVGIKVLTRKGYKTVTRSWMVKKNAKVITAYFDNGKILTGTPDHKILANDKWKRLDAILSGDKVKSLCNVLKRSYSTTARSEDIRMQKREPKGYTLQRAKGKESGSDDYMRRFGRRVMGRFLKVFVSITRTGILLITRWIISNAFHVQIISEDTSKSGTSVTRKGRCSSSFRQRFLNVLSVINQRLHAVGGEGNSVAHDVQVVGTLDFGEQRNVYNLTVDEEHEYFANGILAANCHATVLARVGLAKRGLLPGAVISGGQSDFATKSHTILPDGRMVPPGLIR